MALCADYKTMNYSTTIVCLASSRKPGGRCVAGKEVLTNGFGGWVRPVSERPSAEISIDERRYENGQEPQILEIIDIPMIAEVPRVHQTENNMIDDEYYWTKQGEVEWKDVTDLVDTPNSLWANGESSYSGLNDRMVHTVASKYENSLWLIQPEDITIRVFVPGAYFGNNKRKVRAKFTYNDIRYDLMVTDPIAEVAFLANSNGEYPLDNDTYLCVSLAEAYSGYCYKLVATIIREQGLES